MIIFKISISKRELFHRSILLAIEKSPGDFGYHWNHSSESHFHVSDATGRAMIGFLKK